MDHKTNEKAAAMRKAQELVSHYVESAREFGRRGDTVLRDQAIRQIEDIPGLSRKQIDFYQESARLTD